MKPSRYQYKNYQYKKILCNLIAQIFFLTFILLICQTTVFSQTITGALSGLVIDQDGRPLAGAVVRVINLASGFDYGKRTDQNGNYRIDFLLAGEYQIIVEKDGYQSGMIANFFAEVNREKVIKVPPIRLIALNIITSQNNVLTTAANLIQANSIDVSLRGNAIAEFIAALPLNGIRNFDSLALLITGVVPAPVTNATNGNINGPGIGPSVGTSGQFSVNGQRARANNFTIDGSDNNDQEVGVRRQGFTTPIPQSLDTIQEFQITTLLADAEAGRNTGGQINVVTRSSTNEIHGEAHEYFTNDIFNARDFFDLSGPQNPSKNSFLRNQAGFTISFPLMPNRWQVLTAFEQQIIDEDQETHFAVPTDLERTAALNFARNSSRLGQDLLDPSFYPLPNNNGGPYGINTLTRLLSADGRGLIGTIKLEGKFNIFDRPSIFSGRYNVTDDKRDLPAIDNAINASLTAFTGTQNISLALNMDLNLHMANQLRFSYGRTALNFNEVNGSPLVFQTRATKFDLTGDGLADGRSGPIGRLLIAPFSALGVDVNTFPQGRINNTFQLADTFVLTQSHHHVKFGFDLRRVQLNNFLDRNYRAQIAFNSNTIQRGNRGGEVYRGLNFVAFGLPADINQALAITPNSTLALRFTELNLFVHDQFQLRPNITLSLGLRYERNSVPVDTSGKLEDSLTLQTSQLPPFNASNNFTSVFLDALAAQQSFLDQRKKIYQGDNNNFAPRIGLAWDLKGDGNTTLRIGYGLFYDPILGTVVSQSRNGFPNFIPVDFGSAILFPQILRANPAFIKFGKDKLIPLIASGTLNTIGLPVDQFVQGIGKLLAVNGFFVGSGFGAGVTLPDKNLRAPFVHQYALSLEKRLFNRSLISIAYVGTLGRALIRNRTPNGGQFANVRLSVAPGITPVVIPSLNRINRSLGAVTIFDNSASANYNALQIAITQPFSKRFNLNFAYTYAHAIDDVSDIFDLGGSFATAQDELNRKEGLRAERGNANFDIRHRVSVAWGYQLSNNNHIKILNNLQVASIITLQTGAPFTVNTGVDRNFDGNLTDRLNSINGLIINDRGRVRITLPNNISLNSLLASPNPDNPNNGVIGRNTFRAAGIATVDLALSRSIAIDDHQSITLRLEGFNIFNRVHFGIPVRILEAPSFGASVNTTVAARTLQFSLRYQF